MIKNVIKFFNIFIHPKFDYNILFFYAKITWEQLIKTLSQKCTFELHDIRIDVGLLLLPTTIISSILIL